MTTLNDEVRSVVLQFIADNAPFTGLDVSNKVKLTFPLARHKEVAPLVRDMFASDIQPAGWSRTTINVDLGNGKTAEAWLYHSLTDSWDLDSKYDSSKRSQVALHPASKAAQALGITPTVPLPASLPVPVTAHPMPKIVPATPVAKALPMRDQWMQLFNTKPSLFPVK